MSTWQPSGPPPGERDPQPVTHALARLARRLGGPAPGVASVVFSRWGELVGAEIAAQCRPVSLRERALVVAVDNPAWAAQLRYMAADLRARICDVAGPSAVESITFKVTGVPVPETPFRRGRRPPS